MPYSNVPESDWAKMDSCVEKVMAKDSSLEKSNAIAICHESIVGKETGDKQHAGAHEGHGGAHGEAKAPSPKRRDAREEFNTINRRLAAGDLKPGEKELLERRAERAAREILNIEPENEGGAVQTLDQIEAMVREDMQKSGKSAFEYSIDTLINSFKEFVAEKAGARNASKDQGRLQQIHDLAVENGAECPMMIFKQADGRYRWVTFSSTAFEDRDGEIVSTKAQETDCGELSRAKEYGPLRWWHVGSPVQTKQGDWKSYIAGNGIDIGECDFSDMQGKVRIESGTFHDERVGAALETHIKELSVSIGYSHPASEPKGGIFENIHTFERSLLPLGKQSNYFASIPVINKESKMNDEKKKAFRTLVGDKVADAVLGKADQTEKAAEAIGIAFKEAEQAEQQTSEKVAAPVKKMSDMTDEEFKAYVKKCMMDDGADMGKESKKESGDDVTLKALAEVQTTLKSLQDNDAKIAQAIGQIAEATKSNSTAIKSLQGDLPKSLKSLARSSADDNVVSEETKKEYQPKQQTKDGLGSFLDFAVTGQSNGNKPPAG